MTDTDQGNLSTDESITSGDQQNENLRAESSISTSSNAIHNPSSLLQSNEIRTQGYLTNSLHDFNNSTDRFFNFIIFFLHSKSKYHAPYHYLSVIT